MRITMLFIPVFSLLLLAACEENTIRVNPDITNITAEKEVKEEIVY